MRFIETWTPATLVSTRDLAPGIREFLKRYQERAAKEGIDPVGFYIAPFAYAEMQILQQAVTAVGSWSASDAPSASSVRPRQSARTW